MPPSESQPTPATQALSERTLSKILRWSHDDPQQFFLNQVPSRKVVLIQDGLVTYAYSAARGLSVLMDGHNSEVGTFRGLADVAPLDVVLVSTTKGVFSVEPDLTLKAIVLPTDLQYLDLGSFAYMPAWGVAVFADLTGIWSIDRDKVFRRIVHERLTLENLTALPSGAGVYVQSTKQGDAVLLNEPAGPDGRCRARDPK